MAKAAAKNKKSELVIDEKFLKNNCIFLGDRKETFLAVKAKLQDRENILENFGEISLFEIEKMQISVDDVRRMIGFANRTSEERKIVMLSSFFWGPSSQNAMLKVLEETPPNTTIFLFGLNEKNFLSTVLSRVQRVHLKNSNRYLEIAREVLELDANERLENKHVKKILALKVVDYDYEKDIEKEKKDRESHILFLQALTQIILESRFEVSFSKNFLEKILKISTIAEIDGGSPHLFVEWLLLSTPQI